MAWFVFSALSRHTLGRAEQVNAIFQAIQDAFTNFLPASTTLFKEHRLNYAADSGAVNAYVVALDPVPTAYVVGLTVEMVTANVNTGASTINVNGLGVKNILQQDGSAVTAGMIPANRPVPLRYDGTSFRLSSTETTTTPADGSVTGAKIGNPLDLTGKSITAGTFNGPTIADAPSASLLSTDAGAAAGPTLSIFRDSASPAINDELGEVRFHGRNSIGSKITYGNVRALLTVPTSGAEESEVRISGMKAGVVFDFVDFNSFSGTILRGNVALAALLDLSGAAAGQIKFPSTPNESSNVNTLDGYSDWQSYTPTFTSLGTVTDISMWWKRIGDAIHIRGKFTTGTSTAAEARMSLPGSYVANATKVPSIQMVGTCAVGFVAASSYSMLAESGVSYLTFGEQNGSNNALTKKNGSSIFGTTATVSVNAIVPIA